MPYRSEKIIIANTSNDRRIKLTDEEKQEIILLRQREGISYNKLAIRFGVSKRSIYWIVNPDKLIKNRELRKERGGWKNYYNKEKNTAAIKDTRRHKQKLFIQDKIKLDHEPTDNNE